MESILDSIKKLIGISLEDNVFDSELIININSALSVLNQLGVGPEEGFSIKDSIAVWKDFIGDYKNLETVKTYVYFKTRLAFDPPQNSFLVNNIEKQISELEWRLNVACDKGDA